MNMSLTTKQKLDEFFNEYVGYEEGEDEDCLTDFDKIILLLCQVVLTLEKLENHSHSIS